MPRGSPECEEHTVTPAVLGDQPPQAEQPAWPETAYLPIGAVSIEDEHARLELRHTTQGDLGLVSFSSVEQLVDSYGQEQPWIAIAGEQLPAAAEQTGAQVVLIDVPVPATDGEEQ